MEKVRYGIVGIGKQGSMYASRLHGGKDKNGVLVAVCDENESRRAWAEKELSGVKVFSDYNEMFKSGLINAVIVVTPHYFHPEVCIAGLNAGLNVLCDKPVGVYTKAVREVNKLALEKKEQIFGMMYNQRTDPLYKKAKEIIDSGALGNLKRVSWIITDWYRPQAYYNQGGWRGTWAGEGGGVLINQCPHQLDLLQWLCGMPVKVAGYAKCGVNREINVENDVTAYFEFANGASGVFITSTHDSPGTNRLEIDGDGGQIVVDLGRLGTGKLTYYKLSEFESKFNKETTKFMPRIAGVNKTFKLGAIGRIKSVLNGQHIAVIRRFSEVVLRKPNLTLIANGAEGINGLTISNAIHLSSWLGKPVTLPLDEDLFIAELGKRKVEEQATSKKEVK